MVMISPRTVPGGLRVSPIYYPDAQETAALNPPFLSSLLYHLDDLDVLLATGRPLLVVVNNELAEMEGWSRWDEVMAEIRDRAAGRLIGVVCGNELDRFNLADPNDCPPAFAADLARRAAAILRPAGIPVYPTSLTSPRWTSYLRAVVDLCGDAIDGCAVNLYSQRPDAWGPMGWGSGDLRAAALQAVSIAGKPLVVPEIGVPVGDAGGEAGQGAFLQATARTFADLGPAVVRCWSWFAWIDQLGTPEEQAAGAGWGLRRADGSPRPAWSIFGTLASQYGPNTVPIPAPIPDPTPPAPGPAPEATPMPETPNEAVYAAYLDLWQAIKPDLPYNPDFAFPAYWRDNLSDMGSPVGPEHSDGLGGSVQAFANGVYQWTPEKGVQKVA